MEGVVCLVGKDCVRPEVDILWLTSTHNVGSGTRPADPWVLTAICPYVPNKISEYPDFLEPLWGDS